MSPTTITVPPNVTGPEILSQLGLTPGAPLAILISGVNEITQQDRLAVLLRQALVPALVEANATILDGGTLSGGMGLLNAALVGQPFNGAYIGFVPTGKVKYNDDGSYMNIGLSHTHMVFVEGHQYGQETPAMFALAAALRPNVPALAILFGGGDNSLQELNSALHLGIRVAVMVGSGGLADKLYAYHTNQPLAKHAELSKIVNTGQFDWFEIHNPPHDLYQVVKQTLPG